MLKRFVIALVCLSVALVLPGCAKKEGPTRAADSAAPVEGVERVKPAPGTGNVQGKVLYNNAPVENIDVRLCETFSRFLSGCGGKIYTAKTDKDGDFVITNVPPKEYEGLTVRVFDTDSYVFATTGVAGIASAKYNVVADKTLFVTPTHLFKGDFQVTNPKAGSTVSGRISSCSGRHIRMRRITNSRFTPTITRSHRRTSTSVWMVRRSRLTSRWRRGLIDSRLRRSIRVRRSCRRRPIILTSRSINSGEARDW